jgi:hypothetical protein
MVPASIEQGSWPVKQAIEKTSIQIAAQYRRRSEAGNRKRRDQRQRDGDDQREARLQVEHSGDRGGATDRRRQQ